MSLRDRETGFPEYFNSRTTCLPHPDANLSPDACLTEDDVNMHKAKVRHRMSVLVGRDRSRELATGILTNSGSDTEELLCASPVLMDETSKLSAIGRLAFASLPGAELPRQLGGGHPRSSKDGDSLASISSPEHSPTHSPTQANGIKEHRRRSFLKRLTRR